MEDLVEIIAEGRKPSGMEGLPWSSRLAKSSTVGSQ
jgi:hypothetical protein